MDNYYICYHSPIKDGNLIISKPTLKEAKSFVNSLYHSGCYDIYITPPNDDMDIRKIAYRVLYRSKGTLRVKTFFFFNDKFPHTVINSFLSRKGVKLVSTSEISYDDWCKLAFRISNDMYNYKTERKNNKELAKKGIKVSLSIYGYVKKFHHKLSDTYKMVKKNEQ